MPLKVRLSPAAKTDLLDIWHYIAADNEPAADKLLGRIARVFEMLAHQPHAGRARPELNVPELRSFAVGNYAAFYRPEAETILIVRVLQDHRDIEAEFDQAR
ncbi:MAG TPA: type II toxin-antitoxin system RelE/ParE family toxin [Bosea sp. (in: a-proteobacteria)]|nr:type II toxin-antitoxin system RelE/ParE family toxin [Bosea sp. (in: a-proteobacteria)]